jgi:hypothetical protein
MNRAGMTTSPELKDPDHSARQTLSGQVSFCNGHQFIRCRIERACLDECLSTGLAAAGLSSCDVGRNAPFFVVRLSTAELRQSNARTVQVME